MKFYEAIKLGSLLKPQGFGAGSSDPNASKTCAFGAAYAAVNLDYYGYPMMPYHWAMLLQATLPIDYDCPQCTHSEPRLASIISVHLNDWHKWPREDIADWLEPIEEAWLKVKGISYDNKVVDEKECQAVLSS